MVPIISILKTLYNQHIKSSFDGAGMDACWLGQIRNLEYLAQNAHVLSHHVPSRAHFTPDTLPANYLMSDITGC